MLPIPYWWKSTFVTTLYKSTYPFNSWLENVNLTANKNLLFSDVLLVVTVLLQLNLSPYIMSRELVKNKIKSTA